MDVCNSRKVRFTNPDVCKTEWPDLLIFQMFAKAKKSGSLIQMFAKAERLGALIRMIAKAERS